ncbi:YaaA family protein [Calidifontibacter terrae]
MLVLLPPSETKSTRTRGKTLDLSRLTFPELNDAREQVLDAVGALSAADNAAAVLGVSPNLITEIARNTALRTSPAIPVEQLYTGVLYDALDVPSLDAAARRRARRWIHVQSALFGVLSLRDSAPSYRLSMAVNVPAVGPLAGHWRTVLDEPMQQLAGKGLIVDCRSSTYAAAWTPPADLADRWIHIRVPGATHMAKHTRGLVARAICELGLDPRRPQRLAQGLADRFEVTLTEPVSSTKPWILDAVVRA